MIDFTEIDPDGEKWELFARDYLEVLGFYVDSSPDRGPDGKKDLIVSEFLKGNLGNYEFKWLVSCKHYAKSNRSVSEKDEINIQERLEAHACDGFIGFYSTIPSSGLNSRLTSLKMNNKIKDFRFFDNKLIENKLMSLGFSDLLRRYLPKSFEIVKPINILYDDYIPLPCEYCGKDLLKEAYKKNLDALLLYVISTERKSGVKIVKDLYVSCKGECDKIMEQKMKHRYDGVITLDRNLSEILIPREFINWLIGTLRDERNTECYKIEDSFIKKFELYTKSIAQKLTRKMTQYEIDKIKKMSNLF